MVFDAAAMQVCPELYAVYCPGQLYHLPQMEAGPYLSLVRLQLNTCEDLSEALDLLVEK